MPELNEEAKKRIASLENENQKLEKEVAPLYTAIGKNYYEKQEGHEKEIEKAVGRLDVIKKQIHENRIAILKWKGIRLCPNCGSEVEQGAIFCGECGIRMEAVEDVDENSMLCSRCGAKNEKGKKFCVICGQKLVDIIKAAEEDTAATTEEGSNEAIGSQEQGYDILAVDTAAELATASDSANGAELPQEDVIFCPECGNKLPADALYCTECGAKIETPQEPSVTADDMPMFCPECGTKLSPGSAFCTECGTPIRAGKQFQL